MITKNRFIVKCVKCKNDRDIGYSHHRAILTSKKYQEANQKYLDAQYEKNMAGNAVQSMNMRKEALENLVKLHGQSYFAGPSVPHDLSKLKAEREKATETKIGTRLRR